MCLWGGRLLDMLCSLRTGVIVAVSSAHRRSSTPDQEAPAFSLARAIGAPRRVYGTDENRKVFAFLLATGRRSSSRICLMLGHIREPYPRFSRKNFTPTSTGTGPVFLTGLYDKSGSTISLPQHPLTTERIQLVSFLKYGHRVEKLPLDVHNTC